MSVSKKVDFALESMKQKSLGSVKVLMIEDDSMIQEMVIIKLVSHGCIPYATKDGSEAVSMAEQYKPHIIILDLMLPGKTGEEVLKELKEHTDLSNTPIIVFTNKSSHEDKETLIKLGADKYFVKAQTDLNDLVTTIKDLVSK
ncbi:MAG: response regulator [Candidatus Pacebacteria bacterium]|nr:response regulator [Candidatus Paceibacterota bacterium]